MKYLFGKAKPETEPCAHCEAGPISLFCSDCKFSFCEACASRSHFSMLLKSHNLVSVSQKSSVSSSRFSQPVSRKRLSRESYRNLYSVNVSPHQPIQKPKTFNTHRSGSGMIFSDDNRRTMNICCSEFEQCNFAVINFNPEEFQIALQRTHVDDHFLSEFIGFWESHRIKIANHRGGICYGTSDRQEFLLPPMKTGDILYVNIEGGRACFKLNDYSDTKTIPSGTVFGIWTRKGSEYSIVDYK
ncbi:hypothetical protein P9112_010445 [Eukaryota sp. TZLM1-RC]